MNNKPAPTIFADRQFWVVYKTEIGEFQISLKAFLADIIYHAPVPHPTGRATIAKNVMLHHAVFKANDGTVKFGYATNASLSNFYGEFVNSEYDILINEKRAAIYLN